MSKKSICIQPRTHGNVQRLLKTDETSDPFIFEFFKYFRPFIYRNIDTNMRRKTKQSNGDLVEKKRLRGERLLSDTGRQLQLSDQIRQQLEKIHEISADIRDINNRVLYEDEDLTEKEKSDLLKKEKSLKAELMTREQRLRMLKDIESRNVFFDVEMSPCKKSGDNQFIVGHKKYGLVTSFGESIGAGDLPPVDEETDTEEENIEEEDNEEVDTNYSCVSQSSGSTGSRGSRRTMSAEEELKEISLKKSSRKRVIPERFESFPSPKAKRQSNGERTK